MILSHDPKQWDETRLALEGAVTALEQRPNTYLISGDRGDASITLTANDVEIQMFETALTANRTVTLPQGFDGQHFRIVRTGLGAFTLDVGGLKTIPSATAAFVDIGYRTNAWKLTGYGTL